MEYRTENMRGCPKIARIQISRELCIQMQTISSLTSSADT